MNMKAEEILAKVKEKAAVAADYTAKQAGKVVETTKLNIRLYELNGDIEDNERRIGQIVYAAHRGETADQAELDALLVKLDAAHADAMDLRRKIAERRKKKTCPSCGRACAEEDDFCSGCGASMRDQA